MQVNITITEELLNRIDEARKNKYFEVSRSQFIQLVLESVLNGSES